MRKAWLAVILSSSAAAAILAASPASAQENWNPFKEREEQEARKRGRREAQPPAEPQKPMLAPMDGSRPAQTAPASTGGYQPPDEPYARAGNEPVRRDPYVRSGPPDERSRAVERDELAPVMAADGSGLPHELWRGLDLAKLEELMARLEIPPRSAALHALWKRLVTADIAAPSGSEGRFLALRLEALYRSGLIRDLDALAGKAADPADPLLNVFKARAAIGAGDRERGCELARSLAGARIDMPKPLRAEVILMGGYCAAAGGNAGAAGLAAELAREEGIEGSLGLQVLDALAAGARPRITLPKRVSLLEYRLLELAGGHDRGQLIDIAEPALLAAIAGDAAAEPAARLSAGEAAARINAVESDALAAIYRAQAGPSSSDQLLSAPAGGGTGSPARRAALFKAAEAERTPFKKVRLIRAALDEARRGGLYFPMLVILARSVNAVQPVPEIGWFAETAVETSLAIGDPDAARRWIAFASTQDRPGGSGSLQHWLALADIADAQHRTRRGESLVTLEELALRGRFAADLLHRLATVLDALDYNVPIPLWEAASKTPQPTGGHLPETGVLSELQDAAKKKEFGRTVLLAMRTLGPNGAEGAHMIALGDSIRALKRAGLEADARRLGFEALFAGWPRSASN